jgi:hypothetical protein
MIDEKTLYSWYSEENHKYNTIIWQFPAAILAVNTFAIGTFYSTFSDMPLWQKMVALFFMWGLNTILLYTLAKHIYHQRGFTKALENLLKRFEEAHPEFNKKEEELLVKFSAKKGVYKIFKLKATWVLVLWLGFINLGYLAYMLVIILKSKVV